MNANERDLALAGLIFAGFLALAYLLSMSGCKVADKAFIDAAAKKQRIELNEDLDLQLSTRDGNIRNTVNSVFGMVLLVLAGQVGLVAIIIVAANHWQLVKLRNGSGRADQY